MGEVPLNYYHIFGLGQLMGCLGLKRVEEGPQKGIRHSRSIINRVPEDLYVACHLTEPRGQHRPRHTLPVVGYCNSELGCLTWGKGWNVEERRIKEQNNKARKVSFSMLVEANAEEKRQPRHDVVLSRSLPS